MAHPYPAHHDKLPYVGRHHYFLTFCTNRKEPFFAEPAELNWYDRSSCAPEAKFSSH